MYKGLEHTAIASPDPLRLAQWYVDHLPASGWTLPDPLPPVSRDMVSCRNQWQLTVRETLNLSDDSQHHNFRLRLDWYRTTGGCAPKQARAQSR